MSEKPNDPIFRTIDLSAEVKKIWGKEWSAPEVSYEFSNGRKFYLNPKDVYE